ncbi:hypothetical protein [Burkholderia gladioli]|uniref:hypothetical protein n=1 Tax=Burkholderia gladioli TaxID=28095 RepID=UPI0026563E31|nr:hypothetical protein [Burkholderia gladioli]MDN7750694.1 hypothetical protein [Burkholderia gladioli]
MQYRILILSKSQKCQTIRPANIFYGNIKTHCDLKKLANAEKAKLTPIEAARLMLGSAYETHKTNANHKNAVDLSQYKNLPLLESSFFVPNINHVTNIDPIVMQIIPIPKLISS